MGEVGGKKCSMYSYRAIAREVWKTERRKACSECSYCAVAREVRKNREAESLFGMFVLCGSKGKSWGEWKERNVLHIRVVR